MNMFATGATSAYNAFNTYAYPVLDHAIPKLLGDGKMTTLVTATGRLGAIGLSLAGTYLISSAVNDGVQWIRGAFGSFGGNFTLPQTLRKWSDEMPKFARMPNLLPNTTVDSKRGSVDKLISGLYACALGIAGWEAMLLLSGAPSPLYNTVSSLISPLRLIDGSYFQGAAATLAKLGVIQS